MGIQFKVFTDCSSLRTAFTKRDLVPRIGRWWLLIQEFDFSVEYRQGSQMAHADALSRNPVEKEVMDNIEVFRIDVNPDDWILALQLNDDHCKYLIETLRKNPSDKEEMRVHREYALKQERLYKKTEKGSKWVVPKFSRREIVFNHHDKAGHFSVDKTISAIQEKYWFPNMKRYVNRYIACCLPCSYNKVPSGKQVGFLHPIGKVNIPFDTVHIDHIGPFTQSIHKNMYLIVLIDGFTKYASLRPVQSTRVEPLIKFMNDFIINFGVPRRIICDRASTFTCQKFVKFAQDNGIKIIHNATATPRANGQAERYNRTILSAISTSTEHENRWDECIHDIQWGLNSTVSKSTGKIPNELLFGFLPRSRGDAYLSNEVSEQRLNDVSVSREQAKASIEKSQAYQKQRYDQTRREGCVYEKGQLVLVKKTKLVDGNRKLLPKFSGPFQVMKYLGNDRYIIRDLPGSNRSRRPYEGVTSSDKMKLYECFEYDSS